MQQIVVPQYVSTIIAEVTTPEPPRPAPGRKTAENPTWVAVADAIWLNTKANKKWLYERPTIDGKPTFKALGTTSQKLAKEELARRITLRSQGVEPTARPPTRF